MAFQTNTLSRTYNVGNFRTVIANVAKERCTVSKNKNFLSKLG
jgi:hypothetical protein